MNYLCYQIWRPGLACQTHRTVGIVAQQEQEESDSSAETASTVQQEQAGDAQSSSDAQEQAPARVVWREEDEYGDLDDVLPRPPDGEFILASLQHALDDQPYGIVLQHGHLRCGALHALLQLCQLAMTGSNTRQVVSTPVCNEQGAP